MANFSHVWSGTMVPGFVPAAADFAALDDNVVDSVNGGGGGSYAPSNPIVIGGDGLELHATHVLASDGILSHTSGSKWAGVVIGDNFVIGGVVAFYNTATIAVASTSWTWGATSVQTHHASAATTFNNTPGFANGAACTAGTWNFSGSTGCVFATGTAFTCAAGSTVIVAGGFGFASTATCVFAAPIAQSKPTTMSGTGRIIRRRIAGTDTDQTVDITQGDYLDASQTIFTVARACAIATTGAVADDEFEAFIGVNGTTVLYAVTVNGVVLGGANGAGGYRSAHWRFNGSSWDLLTAIPKA